MIVAAVTEACDTAQDTTIWAGSGKSTIPMNRRRMMDSGKTENRPNPDGIVCDCLLYTSDAADE